MPNVMPKRMRQPGREESSVLAVPDSASTVRLLCERDGWPTTIPVVIRAELWISYDNEATWHLLVGFKTLGGDRFRADGTPYTHSACHRGIKPGVGRKVKAIIDPKIPLRTSVDVEFQ